MLPNDNPPAGFSLPTCSIERGPSPTVPALIGAAGDRASLRFLEFFAASIRNPHTRRAYARAVSEFLAWCDDNGLSSITAVQPLHVSAWVEMRTRTHAAPTVKQGLAALKHLFDWLVTGQVIPTNPAGSVRGPSHVVRSGKTPVLDPEEARALLDGIDTATQAGLRDRALIALMVYTFARIGAAMGMKVEDVFTQNRRLWVRLREKGGKAHAMPCHHNLESYLTLYMEGAKLTDDPRGPLFRTIGRGTGKLTRTPPAPSQRLPDDRPTRGGGGDRYQAWQPQLPGDRHYGLPEERRHAWRRRRGWRTTPARARRSSTTGGTKK